MLSFGVDGDADCVFLGVGVRSNGDNVYLVVILVMVLFQRPCG